MSAAPGALRYMLECKEDVFQNARTRGMFA
jgi:hypothetical protein